MFGPLGTCVACSDSELSFCAFPAQMQQQCHSRQELRSEELVLPPEMQSAWVAFLAVTVAQQVGKRSKSPAGRRCSAGRGGHPSGSLKGWAWQHTDGWLAAFST